MGFFSSFKKGFSQGSGMAKNSVEKSKMFEGTVHTPPPKRTQKDREIERNKKLAAISRDVIEVMEDDEFTEDMERLMRTNNQAYQTQQAAFRKAVLEKYELPGGWYICAHCGNKFKAEDVQADHIKPRSAGGTFSIDNGQVLCAKCNQEKHNSQDQTDEDFERVYQDKLDEKEDLMAYLNYLQDDPEFRKAVNEMKNK